MNSINSLIVLRTPVRGGVAGVGAGKDVFTSHTGNLPRTNLSRRGDVRG